MSEIAKEKTVFTASGTSSSGERWEEAKFSLWSPFGATAFVSGGPGLCPRGQSHAANSDYVRQTTRHPGRARSACD